MDEQRLLEIDKAHVWHPYSAIGSDLPLFVVESAQGVRLKLADGRELIDGMSSWWSTIHGYNHPVMNEAIEQQLKKMSHVMFGGITHQPAVELAEELVKLSPEPLQTVFFADSGSVAVEVAMKMAIQYWHDKNRPTRQHFLTIRGGYHGDTFATMSVCDPVNGMHSLFNQALIQQFFVDKPNSKFAQSCEAGALTGFEKTLKKEQEKIAAVILEPIVQGASGMHFYSADYLKGVRELCDKYGVLLILDEIATGFGRTGKMFACEHAGISPDIMCVGKALTAGYLTLAATLTTAEISQTISQGDPGVFMHGPTFMANPLACAAALASLKLLQSGNWQKQVMRIETCLKHELESCRKCEKVADVRVLGAIGVVEMKEPVDMKVIQTKFVEAGVWVRPFGRLVYVMPPFVINDRDLQTLCKAMVNVIEGS